MYSYSTLGDLIDLIQNGTTAEQNKNGFGLPVTRIETIADCSINENKVGYVSDYNQDLLEKYTVRDGDILISHINSLEHLGKSAIYKGNPQTLLHGMNLLLLRPNKNSCDPFFLNFALTYTRTQGKFAAIAGRAVGQASINQGTMKSIKLPTPNMESQVAIVKVLCGVQAAKEARERELTLERERKAALMQHLFTHGTRGERRKQTPIGEIPESWEVVPLSEVCTLGRGFAFKSGDYVQDGVLSFRVTNIGSNGLPDLSNVVYLPPEYLKEYGKYALNEDDFVIVMVGATTGKIGRVTRDILPALLNQNMWRFFANKEKMLQKYLYYVVHGLPLSLQGAARDYLKQSDFLRIPISLPAIDEQKHIVAILEACDSKVLSLESEITRLNELFHTLLDGLMSGQIPVAPLLEKTKEAA